MKQYSREKAFSKWHDCSGVLTDPTRWAEVGHVCDWGGEIFIIIINLWETFSWKREESLIYRHPVFSYLSYIIHLLFTVTWQKLVLSVVAWCQWPLPLPLIGRCCYVIDGWGGSFGSGFDGAVDGSSSRVVVIVMARSPNGWLTREDILTNVCAVDHRRQQQDPPSETSVLLRDSECRSSSWCQHWHF